MKNRTTFLRWITVMGLALFVYNASAQWKVGVQTGYTHNSLSTESGYAYDRHYDALGGFTVGVPVQYEFANWFALQADLSYTQKNYALYRSGTYADVRSETRNGFMQLPVYTHFSFGEKSSEALSTLVPIWDIGSRVGRKVPNMNISIG